MIQIKHKNIQNIALKHYQAIEEHLKRRRIKRFNSINNWFLNNGLKLSFKKIILADTQLLKKIIISYQMQDYPDDILYLKKMYKNNFALSSKSIGDNGYNALRLMEMLDIKVCPYCNRNFINNIEIEGTGKKRTSQFDHFYNKDKYPFLSMSFYNLVPSCPSCNHSKLNNDISISPYDTRADFDELLTFNYLIKSSEYLKEESDISIDINANDEIKQNVEVLGLGNMYQMHNDIVFELLKKGQIYSKSRLKEINDNFPELFKDEEEMLRVIYGNYINKEEIYKRPLAKLTKDIFNKINKWNY